MFVGHDREAGGREAAHGVAPLGRLDLDHLGAPVGEQRGRGRHEGVLGDFEDAHALHHIGHRHSSSLELHGADW